MAFAFSDPADDFDFAAGVAFAADFVAGFDFAAFDVRAGFDFAAFVAAADFDFAGFAAVDVALAFAFGAAAFDRFAFERFADGLFVMVDE